LSALDRKLREEMKYWIKNLQEKLAITTVYVTHDQNEALTMSDRIAVMNRGLVEQVGTPQEIYELPISRFVTNFIGESNILEGEVAKVGERGVELLFQSQRLHAPRTRDVQVGQRVHFVVRPENVRLGNGISPGRENVLPGTLISQSYQGALIRCEVDIGGTRMISEVQNTPGIQIPAPATPVHVGWPVESTAIITD
jgi:putative spermidine/putrescine transport system ATP-binding protein